MADNFYKNFKSGTDIRGVASEGVEGQNVNLTDDVVKKMAFGFVLWLEKVANKKASEMTISVGRDSRISGERIANDVIDSFKKAGVKVIYTNLSSTPSMFMTTVDLGCDGAVQITASHHPFNRNGLKFFTPNGGLEASDIEEILQYAQDDKKPEITDNGTVEEMDYMSRYSNHLCDIIKKGVNAEDYAKIAKESFTKADADKPGTGAAGGLGFAFLTFTNTILKSGVDLILHETKLEEEIKDADIVITGEGCLDAQTAMGKAPIGVAKLAKKYGKLVLGFSGAVTKGATACNEAGIDAYFPIVRSAVSLEDAMKKKNAQENLTDTVEQVFRVIKALK